MDSYRSLGDMPRRMGFTGPNGGRVNQLPYSEGQLLVTIADDWVRIRTEPQVDTWGARAVITNPGVGLFTPLALTAGATAIRVTYILLDPSTVVNRAFTEGLTVPFLYVPRLLEGFLSTAGPPFPIKTATARLESFTAIGVTFPYWDAAGGFRLGGGVAVQAYGDVLPIILLPGESLIFGAFTANSGFTVSVAWQELPQGDVQTSLGPFSPLSP